MWNTWTNGQQQKLASTNLMFAQMECVSVRRSWWKSKRQRANINNTERNTNRISFVCVTCCISETQMRRVTFSRQNRQFYLSDSKSTAMCYVRVDWFCRQTFFSLSFVCVWVRESLTGSQHSPSSRFQQRVMHIFCFFFSSELHAHLLIHSSRSWRRTLLFSHDIEAAVCIRRRISIPWFSSKNNFLRWCSQSLTGIALVRKRRKWHANVMMCNVCPLPVHYFQVANFPLLPYVAMRRRSYMFPTSWWTSCTMHIPNVIQIVKQ